jgi:hypothetical protein
VGLSAHVRLEGSHMLSAKTPSPAERRREAFAESFLSVKPSTRGKPSSPRGTSLSAKASNPVLNEIYMHRRAHIDTPAHLCLCVCEIFGPLVELILISMP